MNQKLLNETIGSYKSWLKDNDDGSAERAERVGYYRSFDKDKLLSADEDEFVEYIGKLWASNMYGNKHYLVNKMIESNNGFKNLLKLIAEFIYGEGDIASRWDNFYKECKFFGPSSMSELLGYIYPNDFALMNSQVLKALSYLGFSELPRYNYQYTGKNYLKVCENVKKLKTELENNGVTCKNLLAVDYFLWYVTEHIEETNSKNTQNIETADNDTSSFIHKDTIDKIVNIGTMLGFDAMSEVKVASGAKVDAVWSVNIGNMGRVIYVFEVQTKGSIDSLILNLQRAAMNKAVQAVVAVSDEKQLLKIKNEAAPIRSIDIKLWNYESVNEVYENLSKASNVINKLGLVPQDFYY